MKPTVVYHSADFDGIFCREIARQFLPDAEFIGWNFGDAPLAIPSTPLYVMDLPLDRVFGFTYKAEDRAKCGPQHPFGLVWIDHHKTSIDTHPESIPGYRIDGVAACRLAWQWFATGNRSRNPMMQHDWQLPSKQDFIDRKVTEPLAVRLAGEYDIWDKRDPDAETFQYALRCSPVTQEGWNHLLSFQDGFARKLLDDGRVAQRYARETDASICNSRTWLMDWEGLRFLCVNSARFNSLLFAAKDTPETGHDALLGFCFDGKCWTVSLYHAKHRTDLDLSEIAKRHGGGGHRGACGFTSTALPFPITATP